MNIHPQILVLQSFGRENEYRRALFTMLSYIAFTSKFSEILLFTDQPNWFSAKLPNIKIHFVLLTPEKIKHMRGDIDFLHRMKIALIEEAFDRFPDYNLLYADSDTFFYANPAPIVEQLNYETVSMHLWEYTFDTLKDKELPAGQTFVAFYNTIKNQKFIDSKGESYVITDQMSSWNAGVMFFDPRHRRFIDDVYALTHQFYPPSLNHASEQYAFSVILQNATRLIPCDSVVYHYWYKIKKEIADDFFAQQFNDNFFNLTLDDQLNLTKTWVYNFPKYFDNHIWTIKDNAIQSFNENKFSIGYKWALKAMVKQPLMDKTFLKDILYHTKRKFS
jgi:hypothetical protein